MIQIGKHFIRKQQKNAIPEAIENAVVQHLSYQVTFTYTSFKANIADSIQRLHLAAVKYINMCLALDLNVDLNRGMLHRHLENRKSLLVSIN